MGQSMLQTCPHLLSCWRCKDGARYTGCEQAFTNKACEAGFVAGATPTDDGNILGGADGGGISVDDFVGDVGKEGGVCEGKRLEGCVYGVGWVCEVVFCGCPEIKSCSEEGDYWEKTHQTCRRIHKRVKLL